MKKVAPMKKTAKEKLAKKKTAPTKKMATRKVALKSVVKTKVLGKQRTSEKATGTHKKQGQVKSRGLRTFQFEPKALSVQKGEQSGDLQGLSNIQRADSESVNELLEEGNAFEAEVVKGVEDAGNADEREVRTHEVPQDDVPEEYRDKK